MQAERIKAPALRVLVDAALVVCFVAVMATALVQEAPHEYLGVALFALIVAHALQHGRWFSALAKGRYSAVRALQLVVLAALFVCIVGQVTSAVILSEHALAFLPALPGAAWARQVHMLCSYWSFMFAFAHVGLQFKAVVMRVDMLCGLSGLALWAARVVWLAVAVFGVVSFVQLDPAGYLFGQVQFAAADYATPIILSCARYAAIALLVAGVFYYLRVYLEKSGASRVPRSQ